MLLAELDEFRSYLEKCFDFEQVTVKKFRTWAERRQFNRDMKRKQAESERPILPANQKLITLSVQDAPTKKGNRCSTDTLVFRFLCSERLLVWYQVTLHLITLSTLLVLQNLSSTLTGSRKFAFCMNICSAS